MQKINNKTQFHLYLKNEKNIFNKKERKEIYSK